MVVSSVSLLRSTSWVALCLSLTACGEPKPLLILPPADLVTCADEPAAPSLPERDGTEATQTARDLLMLDGYLAMRSAWGDCRSKVEGLRAWRETAGG